MSQLASPAVTKGARVSPDRTFVGVIAIVLVFAVMLASMVFSFTAIVEAAKWTWNPEWALWLSAVIIDGPILVYTVSYAIFRWRGKANAKRSMRVLITFTGISVVVNVLHAAVGWEWQWTLAEMWVGMLIAGAAPVGALLAAHEVTSLVFIQHEDVEPVAEPEVVPEPVVVDEPRAPLALLPPMTVEPPVRPSTSILLPA